MDIPSKKIKIVYMGNAPNELSTEIKQQVEQNINDYDKERLIRDTLLCRICEQQLAVTATTLNHYQEGMCKYPINMIRGLSILAGMMVKN